MNMHALFTFRGFLITVFLLFVGRSLFAQFEFQRIDDDPLSDYETVNLWTTPHYNRVEGLFLHAGLFFKALQQERISFDVQGGYGLKNKSWRYQAGMEKRFFQANRLFLRIQAFRQTTTNESWVIGHLENSLACLLLREDFRNYYGRQGYRLIVDHKIGYLSFLRYTISHYRYLSMQTNTDFAPTLFSWSKSFRSNPAVTEGRETLIEWAAILDYRNNSYFPDKGWYLQAKFQKTFEDFHTTALFLQSGLYIPTFHHQHIATSVYLGFRKGSVANQHLISLGGIGSLRAFPEFYRQGQNMIFARLNYLFGGAIVRALGWYRSPVLDSMSFGLFLEAGDAWNSKKVKDHLLQDFTDVHWLADGGFSLLLFDGLVRFDFAQAMLHATDRSYRVTMRLLDKL